MVECTGINQIEGDNEYEWMDDGWMDDGRMDEQMDRLMDV